MIAVHRLTIRNAKCSAWAGNPIVVVEGWAGLHVEPEGVSLRA